MGAGHADELGEGSDVMSRFLNARRLLFLSKLVRLVALEVVSLLISILLVAVISFVAASTADHFYNTNHSISVSKIRCS